MNELAYVTAALIMVLASIVSIVAICYILIEVYTYIQSALAVSKRKKKSR